MGAFRVLTHFDLNALADQFAQDIKVRPKGVDLLSPEYLIVQTPGMKRWLALESARRNTVFAQTSVLMPKQFIMKLGYWLMGTQELRSDFERDVLPWALYRLIMDGLKRGVSELEQLKTYGGDQNKEMRLFSLAEKTADIFDQYMLYRPEWLDAWESGKRTFADQEAEVWQKYLWNRLVSENDVKKILSPSRYIKQLSEKLKNGTEEDRTRLPRRVFLFGMSILPPQYLDIFSKLGSLIDVTLYLHVPSIHYYGDLQSDRRIQWRHRNQKTHATANLEHDSTENRLLRNLGQMGKEFMDLILDAKPELQELYDFEELSKDEAQPASLLKRVQRDILLCNDSASEPILCDDKDWSIRLAACYGPLREVEVLHDLLLDCFARNTDLAPSDVLVVSPDIALYGPLVEMVFGDAQQRCGVSIPYTIADQSVLSEDNVARFAQDILTAVTGRFEVSVILPLFESASELSGVPIGMEDQEQLKRWCKNSGIRWGYDKSFRSNLQLPPTEEYTWRYGIDRLLAGYAMDDEDRLNDGLYPSVEVGGDGAELLGRLADFVDSIAELARLSTHDHTVDEWNGVLAPLIRRLLAVEKQPEDEDGAAVTAFTGALSNLRERTEISGTESQKFPFAIFMQSVIDELSQSSSGRGFVSGAVTIAGMIPMRSIPFRVVAMLGMNRGTFPRHTVRPLFDLMSQTPARIGDRDSLKSDRYVFLETLLSAQDKLIVTWSGFDSGDGSRMPPSVVVDEFRAHLNREYRNGDSTENALPAGEAVLVEYPLHPFSSRYRSSDAKDVHLQTWNRSWFKSTDACKPGRSLFEWEVSDELVDDDGVIDGNAVINALSDPIKTFLEVGCRIQRPAKDEVIEDDELFDLDNLREWGLRNAILKEELGIEADAVGKLIAKSSVPPGTPGANAVEKERQIVKRRYNVTQFADSSQRFGKVLISKTINGRRYRINIDVVSMKDDAAVILEAGKANAKRRLKLWICHLFLNLGEPVKTTFVALDKTITLSPVGRGEAIARINALYNLAKRSKKELLPFVLEVSRAFVEQGESKEDARKEAWKQLRDIIILNSSVEYLYNGQWADAFGNAENWNEAMSKIPGGEESFAKMAEEVFLPFPKCTRGGI